MLRLPPGRADLHAHTTASDGRWSPAEMVRAAAGAGLAAVAITDHDTTAGLAAATADAPPGLIVVPGVELSASATARPDAAGVHLLGYWLDPEALAPLLAARRADRRDRLRGMLARLAGLGMPLSEEEVAIEAGEAAPGRPHVARALVRLGLAPSVPEVFDRYLADGRPAYVPAAPLPVEEAIAAIRAAGGAAVLAHPGKTGQDARLPGWIAAGLAGIEVDHPGHDPDDRRRYRRLAARYGLIATGGSDSHGPDDTLGRESVPLETVERLRAAASR